MPAAVVRLAYGETGLDVSFPAERMTVVEPAFETGASDAVTVLRTALRNPVAGPPLREIVQPGQSVAIAVCDVTRPQPHRPMVSAVLDELSGLVRPGDVTILVATGTHRACTSDELRRMLGDEILAAVHVVNHDSRDDRELKWCGRLGTGVPVWLNRQWLAANVRVTTGFVEPHFFAGFSGGPKLVAPGLAGLETVLTLHNASRIGHPNATWGVVDGNPVHDDIRAIAAATGVDFALDVTLNRDQQITAAYGGELFPMHAAAREKVRRNAMHAVPAPYDVVVTTNAGYPLDQNLYQAVKGVSAAAKIVKPGGAIVCVAECRDGFPDRDRYLAMYAADDSPQALLEKIEKRSRTLPDQWSVQVQAKVQSKARVYVSTPHIMDADLRAVHLKPAHDVAETVDAELRAAGPNATLCVMPEGPQTIAYVE